MCLDGPHGLLGVVLPALLSGSIRWFSVGSCWIMSLCAHFRMPAILSNSDSMLLRVLASVSPLYHHFENRIVYCYVLPCIPCTRGSPRTPYPVLFSCGARELYISYEYTGTLNRTQRKALTMPPTGRYSQRDVVRSVITTCGRTKHHREGLIA